LPLDKPLIVNKFRDMPSSDEEAVKPFGIDDISFFQYQSLAIRRESNILNRPRATLADEFSSAGVSCLGFRVKERTHVR
jgi:hypothetical protein